MVSEPGYKNLIIDVIEYTLSNRDKFVIVASDGIWEYLSNEQAVEIVSKYYDKNDHESASNQLVKIARSKWENV